jgi:hypothetical protein
MLTATALIAATVLAPADKIDLTHTYKKGDKAAFAFEIKGDENGQDVGMSIEWQRTVGNSPRKGVYDIKVDASEMQMFMNGQEMPGEALGVQAMEIDGHGLPTNIAMDGGPSMLISIAQMFTFLPSKTVEIGEKFEFNQKYDTYSLKGKGTLKSAKAVNGSPAFQIKYSCEFMPGEEDPATIDFTAVFDAKSKVLLEAKGEADTDDGVFHMQIKNKKK